MAHFHSPRIITDGLTLILDAANHKSYSGTGTEWKDLSGNGNNGELINSPTFNSDNGGSLVFDGINNYVETMHNTTENSFTVAGWIFHNGSVTSQQPIISKWFSGNLSWIVDVINLNTIRWSIRSSPDGDVVISTTIIPNIWFFITATYQSGTGNCNFYINSNFISNGSGRTSLLNPTNKIQIGRKGDSTSVWFNGSISQVQIYNRVLSSDEILQNYNATKGRYGL